MPNVSVCFAQICAYVMFLIYNKMCLIREISLQINQFKVSYSGKLQNMKIRSTINKYSFCSNIFIMLKSCFFGIIYCLYIFCFICFKYKTSKTEIIATYKNIRAYILFHYQLYVICMSTEMLTVSNCYFLFLYTLLS